MTKRKLKTGDQPPDAAYAWIPPEKHFEDAESDFLGADDLKEIAHVLIAAYPEEFEHLGEMKIECAWKRKGGGRAGKFTLGKCVKVKGLVKYFGQCDFVVWVGADHARDFELTNYQVEALLFHELLHATVNDKGKPKTRGHDFEGFDAEVRHYGCWKPDMKKTAEAFRQLSFEEVAA